MNSKLHQHDAKTTIRRISMDGTSKAGATVKRSLKRGMKLLPHDFVPSSYSVICGRGKGNYNAIGNRRLRVIVGSFLQQYIDAEHDPNERSRIVDQVIGIVKDACPTGGFIKYENNRYYELSVRAAREKCGALLRDCMQSSSRERQAQRHETHNSQQQQESEQLHKELQQKPTQQQPRTPMQQALTQYALYSETFPLAAAGGEPLDAPSMIPSSHVITEPLSRQESFGSSCSSNRSTYGIDAKTSVRFIDHVDVNELNDYIYNDDFNIGRNGSTLLYWS